MKARSVRQYLRPLKSPHFRSLILAEARRRVSGYGMNDHNRKALAEAVFAVENEAEHKRGREYPPIVAMRDIRNALYRDLGWNESTNLHVK